MTDIILRLYGRPACHLCEDMERALRRLQAEYGFELELFDIDRDPELVRRFGARVPVLMAGEHELCHFFLDRQRLERYFGAL